MLIPCHCSAHTSGLDIRMAASAPPGGGCKNHPACRVDTNLSRPKRQSL